MIDILLNFSYTTYNNLCANNFLRKEKKTLDCMRLKV